MRRSVIGITRGTHDPLTDPLRRYGHEGTTWHRTDTDSPLFAIAGKDASNLVATIFYGLYLFDGNTWTFVHTGRHCQKATVDDAGGVWATAGNLLLHIKDRDWTSVDRDSL